MDTNLPKDDPTITPPQNTPPTDLPTPEPLGQPFATQTPPPSSPPPPPAWTNPLDIDMNTTMPEPNPPPPAPTPAPSSSLFLPDGHELNHHGPAPKLIIGMLLVALILLSGGLFLMSQRQTQIKSETALIPTEAPTPTPNPTAGWLTYTDSKFGYTVMYPPTGAFETGKPYFGTLGTQETPAAFMTGDGLLTILPNYKTATFTPLLTEPVMIGRLSVQKNFEATNSAVIKEVPISSTQTVAFTYKLPDDPAQAATINKLFDQILSTFTLSTSSESAMPEAFMYSNSPTTSSATPQ